MHASETRKAAILLMSLPEEEAGQLMSKARAQAGRGGLDRDRQAGPISRRRARSGHQRVRRGQSQLVGGGTGGLDLAKSLRRKGVGQKRLAARSKTCGSRSRPCRSAFCKSVDSQNLLTFIIDEHPQTIALILSHLQPSQAADIISGLPSDRQLAVIRRIATMGQTNPESSTKSKTGSNTAWRA